mmetsp:Transcript_102097/g.218613  ORF Transcript_102097/g.218613 Transcript_102097/m.218613 type:complete len:230 (+) Transcript_102097:57-746(+)
MTFAASLTDRVRARLQRNRLAASQWLEHEEQLLADALELFKKECKLLATEGLCKFAFSFAEHMNKVRNFPKACPYGTVVYWGICDCPEPEKAFFYATQGAEASFDPEFPTVMDELLKRMHTKFVSRIKNLGFARVETVQTSTRCWCWVETFDISVVWLHSEEPAAKRPRLASSDVRSASRFCHQGEAMQDAIPCVHLMCDSCFSKVELLRRACLFRNTSEDDMLPIVGP